MESSMLLSAIFRLMTSAALLSPVVMATDISQRVFGSERNWLPMAFGDYNNDKQPDMFVLNNARDTVHVLLMEHTRRPMVQLGDNRQTLECHLAGMTVLSVVPSDFDGDGVMDIVVVVRNNSERSDLVGVMLFWGDLTALHCQSAANLTLLQQPLALDFDGDMATDLLARTENGSLAVWQFFGRNPTLTHVLNGAGADLRADLGAFADVDGDLAADLVLTAADRVEVWRHHTTGWHLKSTNPLPGAVYVGQAIVVDLESSGHLQLIVPVCYDNKCQNSSLLLLVDNVGWVPVLLEAEDSVEGVWGFRVPESGDVYGETIVARVGDYNLDGYPDLLMSLARKDGSLASLRSFLLENVACPPAANCATSRAFSAQWRTFADLSNSPAAAFFDFGDDGLLDALVVHRVDGSYVVSAEANSPDYDALFLKVTVISGGCLANCSHGVHLPYGTNRPGPTVRGLLTLTDGSVRRFAAGQLWQSAHHSLQLPYAVFGLGRSPNFVDQLTVGVPSVAVSAFTTDISSSDHISSVTQRTPLVHHWTQLIPNSQLIVIPHPPSSPSRWLAKLYVTPGETIITTVGALLGTLLATVLVVLVLHWRERRQDRLERMQAAHRFNFDAM